MLTRRYRIIEHMLQRKLLRNDARDVDEDLPGAARGQLEFNKVPILWIYSVIFFFLKEEVLIPVFIESSVGAGSMLFKIEYSDQNQKSFLPRFRFIY